VRCAGRIGRLDPVDVGQRPQQNATAFVGFQRGMHGLAEVAVFDVELHRTIDLGFAGSAQQFDDVLAVEVDEMEIVDLFGLVDLVECEGMFGLQIDFVSLTEILDPGRQLKADRPMCSLTHHIPFSSQSVFLRQIYF